MTRYRLIAATALANLLFAFSPSHADDAQWVVYEGKEGPGKGKHVVLISGDEEYRSEEALPQMGKILAVHHGFKCTVLFSIDPKTGEIAPTVLNNIPGLEALETADLMIIATRFRNLPDEQMKYIDDYLKSGRPVIGLRTATHAFNMKGKTLYSRYSFNYRGPEKEWAQGFGRAILGETWVSHWGNHKSQSTRGIIHEGAKDHPIAHGLKDGDVWGPSDVYEVRLPLPEGSVPIVMGQVMDREGPGEKGDVNYGMKPTDSKVARTSRTAGRKGVDPNDPMMPVGWTKSYQIPGGKPGKVFTSTMGSSTDLVAGGTRRMLVNAVYWCVGLADAIPSNGTKVDLVGEFNPRAYSFGGYQKGVKPADHQLKPE